MCGYEMLARELIPYMINLKKDGAAMSNEEKILQMLEGLTVEVKGISGKLERLESKVGMLEGKVDTLEGKVDRLTERVDKQGVVLEVLVGKVESLEQGQNELMQDIAKLKQSHTKLEQGHVKLEQSHVKLEQDIERIEKLIIETKENVVYIENVECKKTSVLFDAHSRLTDKVNEAIALIPEIRDLGVKISVHDALAVDRVILEHDKKLYSFEMKIEKLMVEQSRLKSDIEKIMWKERANNEQDCA